MTSTGYSINTSVATAGPWRHAYVRDSKLAYSESNKVLAWLNSAVYMTADSEGDLVDEEYYQANRRFRQLERSFSKNKETFPSEKTSYFKALANALCKLPFVNNFTEYCDWNESIYSELDFANGLNLKVNMFLDEEEDSPLVFSIFRGKALLVSDELPAGELASLLGKLIKKYYPQNEA